MITFVFDQYIPPCEAYILVIKPISTGYYVYQFRGQVEDTNMMFRGISTNRCLCSVENPYGESIRYNYDYSSVWIIPLEQSSHVIEAFKENIHENYCSFLNMEQFDVNLTRYHCNVYEEYLNLI